MRKNKIKGKFKTYFFLFALILVFFFSFQSTASAEQSNSCYFGLDKKSIFPCENITFPSSLKNLLPSTGLKGVENNAVFGETSGLADDEGEYIIIESNEEWAENKTLEDKFVLVQPGVELKIKKGVTISLKNSIIGALGKILVEGAASEPVKFQALETSGNEGFSIMAGYDDSGQAGMIEMSYADISGGGVYADDTNFMPLGAVTVEAANLKIRECHIHNNRYGVLIASQSGEGINVNRTKIFNNEMDVLSGTEAGLTLPDFRYNWWGSANGPEKLDEPNEYGEYQKIWGNADLSPWFVSEDFYDPVIIIPGIMGSAEINGQLKIDPILGTYKNLIASFEENGYEKGKNLFEFPYEWRNSNVLSAEKLKEKIDEIKSQTGLPAVDLVAHSMGGLVARYYIEGENYQNDVSQLITMGTPHKGSPKSYLTWEAGEGFENALDKIAKAAFMAEAFHSGYTDLKEYIQSRIKSVQELLPDYDYLKDATTGEIRQRPQNIFLEFLNSDNRVNNLNKVYFVNIIGNTNSDDTIKGFRVVDSNEDEKWEDGMPENFYDNSTNRGIEYGEGDKTVPLFSAEGIVYNKKIEKSYNHGDLPTGTQCDVIKGLIGEEECEYVSAFDRIKEALIVLPFSPIDIQVIAPDGKKIGKNFETGEVINEIEGAYYTGFNMENEFLTIPNPLKGEYQILTQGTGEGEYKIEISKITEKEDSQEAEEITATIQGNTILNQEKEQKIEVQESEIIVEDQDVNSPEIFISSPEENKVYANHQILPLNYQIQDDQSLPENIEIQTFFDGKPFTEKNIDLSLQNLGEHKFKVTAIDEAGNIGEKEIRFETKTDISAIIKNVNHYANLGLIRDRQDKVVLLSRLLVIYKFQDLMEKVKNSRFIKEKAKDKLTYTFQEQINKHLDWLINYVEKRSDPKAKNRIDPKTGNILIESFNFVKGNF